MSARDWLFVVGYAFGFAVIGAAWVVIVYVAGSQ